MLNNISLGQYFPGNSAIHRIDPRVKLILTFAYIIILFCCKGPIPYIVSAITLLSVIYISKISLKIILRGVKPVIILLLITTIFNIFYTTGGIVLVQFGFITITSHGLLSAAYMVVRIILLIIGTFVMLTYTTSPIMLTDGLESVLSPLKRIHVPVHELSMMMTIALRFIPTLIEETNKIVAAQASRGADFDSGNIFARAKALIPILIPLFVSSFRRAEDLATAMECRCYRGDIDRTRLRVLKISSIDIIAILIGILCFSAMLIFSYVIPVGVII